jgi:mannan endo-1,4-beta-mannosidase
MLPIDPDATTETRALLRHLGALEGRHVLFGHQDDFAYGTQWSAEPGRSDVHDVVGVHPAVFGFDLGHIEIGADRNLDGLGFDDIRG